MALTDITVKILSDSKLKAEGVIEEAKIEAEKILRDAKSESSSLKEEILNKADKECGKRLKSAEISFNMQLKNAALSEKQAILDEVFDNARRSLLDLKAEEYRNLIKRVLFSVIKDGDEEIVVSENDRQRLNENFVSALNRELASSGKKGKLRIGFDKRLSGGFVVKAKKIQIDCSIDSMLELIRPQLQNELLEILFG
jgi:V/A-type H+-transporting ATPase subunit E